MKAGNGIIHDENLIPDAHDKDRLTHAFQFWINLPAKNKTEPPQYLAIQANDVPQQMLNAHTGWLKVIAGGYDHLHSNIPGYSKQFIYHLHLEPGKQFSLDTENGLEYAAFLPEMDATINDSEFDAGEFIEFDRNGGIIEIVNKNKMAMDIILFGGEHYTEPIVAEGPFVMNSHLEVADAYKDFFAGKYGKINY
jgi:redox-sensitive bicupin YhaK (pirin superfamily)